MRAYDVGGFVVCDGSDLVGTLCDRDIILANASPSEAVDKMIMTLDQSYCFEKHLFIDAQVIMRVRRLNALPIRDLSGRLCGIVTRPLG